jgi:hypothetical protein
MPVAYPQAGRRHRRLSDPGHSRLFPIGSRARPRASALRAIRAYAQAVPSGVGTDPGSTSSSSPGARPHRSQESF